MAFSAAFLAASSFSCWTICFNRISRCLLPSLIDCITSSTKRVNVFNDWSFEGIGYVNFDVSIDVVDNPIEGIFNEFTSSRASDKRLVFRKITKFGCFRQFR